MRTTLLTLLALFGSRYFAQNNNALEFSNGDAELNYSTALDFDLTDKFTIEAWTRTTASYAAIIFSDHVNQFPNFLGTEAAIVNGFAVFEVINTDLTNGIRVETTNIVNDGEWHHLAFSYGGSPSVSSISIYIDGLLQNLNITFNNLSSTFASGNEFHMGSRDNTVYYSDISIDELRVWKRVLCGSEISSRMYCKLKGNEPTLEAYYTFDQGVAGGNNATVNTVIDQTGHGHDAAITGLALSGNSSNWVTGVPMSGVCSTYGNLSVGGPTLLCIGSQATLSVSGVQGATWTPGGLTGGQIVVSPTVSTTYTVLAFTNTTSSQPFGCLSQSTISLLVKDCAVSLQESALENLMIYPNPVQGELHLSAHLSSVQVWDAAGRLVISLGGKETSDIDVTSLSPGVYHLKGVYGDRLVSQRFLKE